MADRVAVVIPAYNAAKYLAEAIESVQRQTRPDWNLVIVDDGSQDATASLAESYSERDPRIRVVRQSNGGIAAARNRGTEHTNPASKYIAYLDADDVWESDLLERLIGTLERSPGAVAAHGRLRRIGPDGQAISLAGTSTWPDRRRAIDGYRLTLLPVTAPTTFATLVYANIIPTSGIVVQRAAKDSAGPFDPEVPAAEDWDMWLRISRKGDIVFLNDTVVRYRHSGMNYSLNRALMSQALTYVRKKLLTTAELTERERQMVRLGYRYYELYQCLQHCRYARGALAARSVERLAGHLHSGLGHAWRAATGFTEKSASAGFSSVGRL